MLVLDKEVCEYPVLRITNADREHTMSGRTTDADFGLAPTDRLLLLRG